MSSSGAKGSHRDVAEAPVRRITTTGAKNGQAFWSPDGRHISFVSNRSASWEVWIMRRDGTELRQMTASGSAGWPSWSPDGKALFYYARQGAGYRILRLEIATKSVRPILEEGMDDFRPSLSADGQILLFDRFGPSGNHDLFITRLATGATTQLTTDPGYDSDARWSPDGRHIVWHSDRNQAEKYHVQIFIMNGDGTEVRQLTHGPARHMYPSWSPDGRRIAYTEEVDGNRDVWIMDMNGKNPRRITTHPGFDGDPVFLPSGDSLLFSTDRYGGQELAIIGVVPR